MRNPQNLWIRPLHTLRKQRMQIFVNRDKITEFSTVIESRTETVPKFPIRKSHTRDFQYEKQTKYAKIEFLHTFAFAPPSHVSTGPPPSRHSRRPAPPRSHRSGADRGRWRLDRDPAKKIPPDARIRTSGTSWASPMRERPPSTSPHLPMGAADSTYL